MSTLRHLYFNRRVGIMLPLGFASGLPLALTGSTLTAWARDTGVSLSDIGILSLVAWPYAIKFAWAPLIDRYSPPWLDRRRSWIITMQVLLIAAIAGMGVFSPANHRWALAVMAVAVSLFSATQDIPLDAYRTDVLAPSQRGSGAAVYVGGYRLGMIVSGAATLVMAGWGLPWRAIYFVMAGCMSIGILATLFAERAPEHIKAPPSLRDAVIAPLVQFFARPSGWLVIAFVIVFKLPDITASQFSSAFLIDMGVSKAHIGWLNQGLGLGISIVGGLVGGVLVNAIRLRPSLWIFGILHGVANLGFYLFAQYPHSKPMLITAIGAENFCAGLVTAGFTAFLMSQCDRQYTAFQFALLSAGMAVSRLIAGTGAGYLADHLGWSHFFLINIALALPGLLLLPFLPMHVQEEDDTPEPRGFEVIVQKQ